MVALMRSLALLSVAALLTGCPADANAPSMGEAADQIKTRKTFVVVTDASYAPFEVLSKEGVIEGFDVELSKEIAKDLGAEAKVQNTAWDGIIPQLMTGRADAILSGMSVTEERQKAVSFSEPYFHVGQVFLMRKGDDRIKDHTSLNDPKFKVATQRGTTGEKAVRKFMPKAEMIAFEKADDACMAVRQSKADVVVFDHPFLMKYMEEQKAEDLVGVWTPFTYEPIAVAIRKDSPKLLAAVNATIARLKKSGRLAELTKQFFGKAAELSLKKPE